MKRKSGGSQHFPMMNPPRMIHDRMFGTSATDDVHEEKAHIVKVDVCDLGVECKADE
jgi:hypothetical protein